MPSKSKKKRPTLGDSTYIRFYDHCEYDNTSLDAVEKTKPIVMEFLGWYVAETEESYVIQLVRANERGNEKFWHVLKPTVLQFTPINTGVA